MNTIVTAAVWGLAVFALIQASIIDPPESTKTGRQCVSRVRQMKWWHPAYWVAAVVLVFPLYVIGSASRYALHVASLWLAKGFKKLAAITAMDSRQPPAYQPVIWREVRP
jgi:hypothetical protein